MRVRRRRLDIDEVFDLFARLEGVERDSTLDLIAVSELRAIFESFKKIELAAFDARLSQLEHGIEALAASIGVNVSRPS